VHGPCPVSVIEARSGSPVATDDLRVLTCPTHDLPREDSPLALERQDVAIDLDSLPLARHEVGVIDENACRTRVAPENSCLQQFEHELAVWEVLIVIATRCLAASGPAAQQRSA